MRFYKMRMSAQEQGITVTCEEFESISEAPMSYLAVRKHDYNYWHNRANLKANRKLSAQKVANKLHIKTYRIFKGNSRVAFDTKEKAWDHLRFLKTRQRRHLQRDLAVVSRFLMDTEDGSPVEVLPDSVSLLSEYYLFD